MKIKRLTSFFAVVVTVGYIVCVRHSRLLRRSLQIGDMDWIYMGNNRSEIQFNGRTIVMCGKIDELD